VKVLIVEPQPHKASSSSLGLSNQEEKVPNVLSVFALVILRLPLKRKRKVGCFAAIIKEVSIESSVPG